MGGIEFVLFMLLCALDRAAISPLTLVLVAPAIPRNLQTHQGAAVAIDSTGWEDVVVWNPHKTMESCYESFVCVENAITNKKITVQPGKDWRATATFQVVDV